MTEKKIPLRRNDLLFPELSYTINGVLFDVFKQIGGGHQEKYYQKAVAIGLKEKQIKFEEQVYVPLKFNGEIVGKYFLDFLIEGSIILELKRGKFIPAKVIDQTKQYLDTLHLELGLIECFTTDGVFTKRIIHITKSPFVLS